MASHNTSTCCILVVLGLCGDGDNDDNDENDEEGDAKSDKDNGIEHEGCIFCNLYNVLDSADVFLYSLESVSGFV